MQTIATSQIDLFFFNTCEAEEIRSFFFRFFVTKFLKFQMRHEDDFYLSYGPRDFIMRKPRFLAFQRINREVRTISTSRMFEISTNFDTKSREKVSNFDWATSTIENPRVIWKYFVKSPNIIRCLR